MLQAENVSQKLFKWITKKVKLTAWKMFATLTRKGKPYLIE